MKWQNSGEEIATTKGNKSLTTFWKYGFKMFYDGSSHLFKIIN